ncbi:endonuclease V [Halalkaliarchaeum desulfuricum]|uniref:Endonuclease V n=1 Tax=Halalkaliarchaeum desulfuricum TaxID=2055893 RepID=A0A343TF63_9EURY|nr:endonuclease V [Halalkaliarchaeum desulfuricum]AUX07735.1 endonuclease V [Halalkaliarchaeum desulfuricum]
MKPVRPQFVPEPGLDREEMLALQRELTAAAVFEDDLSFSPAEVALVEPVQSRGPNRSGDHTLASFSKGDSLTLEGDTLASNGDAFADVDPGGPPVVAGVDQAFIDDRAISAVVLLQGRDVVGWAHAVSEPPIPYVPGLLAFREGGPIVDALATLAVEPDLLVFDGSGRIHFREAGLATHVGVVFDCPAVGVAKSLLCGTPDEPTDGRPEGWSTPIRVGADDDVTAPEGTVIGYAYQSRQYDGEPRINPLYVSPGHRASAETARELVAALSAGYKLPEPTRLADRFADELKGKLANDT